MTSNPSVALIQALSGLEIVDQKSRAQIHNFALPFIEREVFRLQHVKQVCAELGDEFPYLSELQFWEESRQKLRQMLMAPVVHPDHIQIAA